MKHDKILYRIAIVLARLW